MTSKLVLLDLFCKAGGAGMGYARAGFEVIGVDIEPQKHYPFEFVRAEALSYALSNGWKFDAIHASPPCQAHSVITPDKSKHVDLIPHTRFVLKTLGVPYVIENVPGARKALHNPIMLCGRDFDLKVYRHRYFESNVPLSPPCPHLPHHDNTPRAGHGVSSKGFVSVTGHISGIDYCRMAMGIDWMTSAELVQAIPPAYTEHIGQQLMVHILRTREKIA